MTFKTLVRNLTTLSFVFAALFATTATANANPHEYQYAPAMSGLLLDVANWSADTSEFVEAVAAKPELACGAEMSDLGMRGASIAADIAGVTAPDGLQMVHAQLQAGISNVATASSELCSDPGMAAEMLETIEGQVSPAAEQINGFVSQGVSNF